MTDPNLDLSRNPPSLWAHSAAPPIATTALPPGEHEAELLVIGAGVTGLAAALHAAGRGARVVLLEAGELGWGASGRNNGQVIPCLTRADPDRLVQVFGAEHGETLVALLRDSANVVFDLVRRHAIDCEAVQHGWVQPAHRPSRLALARSRVEQWRRRGASVDLLDRDQVEAITGSRFWCGGWQNASGGHLNPLAFCRGLARAAQAGGAALYTHTAVGALRRAGAHWQVDAAGGATLRARRVLVATHSYSGFATASPWPGLPQAMVAVRGSQLSTLPLPPAIRATILPQGHAMSDTQADLHFGRFDAAGRLVTGGGLALPLARASRLRRHIGARLLKLFPQLQPLAPLRFDHYWHGVLAITPDKLPRFWRLDDGVAGWGGCNGRGLAFGTALGPVLADALLDGDRAAVKLPFEAPRPIAGHRWAQLAVPVTTLYYRWLDRRD